MAERLLTISELEVRFDTPDGTVEAVNGVDLHVDRGEVVAVVGESGSGKTVTAMTVLGLQPGARTTGSVEWKGEELLGAPPARMQRVRGGEIAMIFQDASAAMNPVHTVGRQVAEMVRVHQPVRRREAAARAVELLDLVGIPQPQRRAKMHPHEFSGGMRQRAMIAMAIANKPDLLIADEPTTALDVTVQAQILEVIVEIKDEIDSAVLLITHDLGVVAGLADRVAVMYAGRLAETAGVDDLFARPAHPYTRGLLCSLPSLESDPTTALTPIKGQPPSLLHRPSGCAFHPRCPLAEVPGRCDSEVPELRPVPGTVEPDASDHRGACHLMELGVAAP